MALTGLTVAEYFRDEEGQDVLLFVDNIFRFTQARTAQCKIAAAGNALDDRTCCCSWTTSSASPRCVC